MSFDVDALRLAIAEHGRVARVVVADFKGSVPREIGASMLVWPGGQLGTIGGGTLEFEAARRTTPGIAQIPLGPALGQCCGGHVTLVTEVFDAQSALPETGVWSRRIAGHAEKPLSILRAERDLHGGASAQPRLNQGWWVEPVNPGRTPLWIYGAGHVGRALVDVLHPLPNWAITWIDTAPDRFPDAARDVTVLPAAHPADTVRLAPADAIHLIVTYSHALDLELCHRLLGHGARFIGLIGSATKWARFQSRLRALGHTNAQIARIICPIGDPALGKHPQAIAVGVAASLLSPRHQDTSVASGETALTESIGP